MFAANVHPLVAQMDGSLKVSHLLVFLIHVIAGRSGTRVYTCATISGTWASTFNIRHSAIMGLILVEMGCLFIASYNKICIPIGTRFFCNIYLIFLPNSL